MTRLILFGLLTSFLFLSGCISTKEFQYDRQFDFNYLKKYSWNKVTFEESLNKSFVDEVKQEIDNTLSKKGLQLVSNSSDCFINLHISEKIKDKVSKLHSEQLSRKKQQHIQFQKITVSVSMSNPKTKLKLWWGSFNFKMNFLESADFTSKTIKTEVNEFFKNFPPPLSN